jgi:hypothetical protein
MWDQPFIGRNAAGNVIGNIDLSRAPQPFMPKPPIAVTCPRFDVMGKGKTD